jgi:integrase
MTSPILMLLQGCRPEEVMSLKKSSYDATRGELRIEGGKSKAAKRTLYLCGESIEILSRRMKLVEARGFSQAIAFPAITSGNCTQRMPAFARTPA